MKTILKKPSPKTRDFILFYLNGVRHSVSGNQASLMLSDYLRYDKNLVGTKVVCAEGDCGACSVLRLVPGTSKNPIYLPVNSCILPVSQLDCTSLVTVDALAKSNEQDQSVELTPVQTAMVESHGSQCGFCTPGFVIALTGLVEKKLCQKQPRTPSCMDHKEAMNALTGNLCRCTGYQPIINAAVSIDLKSCTPVANRFFSPTQSAELVKFRKIPVLIKTESYSFSAPKTPKEAALRIAKNPSARVLGAATDLGVAVNKGKEKIPHVVSLHLIDELYQIKTKKTRMTVGARVTLTELREALKNKVPEFSRFLDLFASPQIKNSATLVGNVANASPIGDTPPFLLVADAVLHTIGPGGKRKIKLTEFYTGYRKTVLKKGELITAIEFDLPAQTESLALYKTSQRKDLDISAVNAAFRVEWTNRKKEKIKMMRIALGGVAATPLRIFSVETALKGKVPDESNLAIAMQALQNSITPLSDLRATGSFRRVVVENLFTKFFREHDSSGVKP